MSGRGKHLTYRAGAFTAQSPYSVSQRTHLLDAEKGEKKEYQEFMFAPQYSPP